MEIVSKLPNDITKIIFQYVSFTPFDKEDFLKYFENKSCRYLEIKSQYSYWINRLMYIKKDTYNMIIKNKLHYHHNDTAIIENYGSTIYDNLYEYRNVKREEPSYFKNERFTKKLRYSQYDYSLFNDDYDNILKHTKIRIKNIIGLDKPLSRLSRYDKHKIFMYYQYHFY